MTQILKPEFRFGLICEICVICGEKNDLSSYILSGLVQIVIIARRAVLEERLLRKELKGYDLYMDQVKYRFIPYVW